MGQRKGGRSNKCKSLCCLELKSAPLKANLNSGYISVKCKTFNGEKLPQLIYLSVGGGKVENYI